MNPRLLDPGPALAFRFDSDPAQDQIFFIKFDGNLWPSCKWVPIYFKLKRAQISSLDRSNSMPFYQCKNINPARPRKTNLVPFGLFRSFVS